MIVSYQAPRPALTRAEPDSPSVVRQAASRRLAAIIPYLEAMPLAAVFVLFFAVPIVLVVVVSFFDYQTYQILIPDFTFENYREVFSQSVTYETYRITLKFCAIGGRSRRCWDFSSPTSWPSRCAAGAGRSCCC